MSVIKKKTTPEDFKLVLSGVKKIEIRVADFELKEGDTVVLEEWDPVKKKYTGKSISRKVGYIHRFPLDKYGQRKLIEKHGLLVFSLED